MTRVFRQTVLGSTVLSSAVLGSEVFGSEVLGSALWTSASFWTSIFWVSTFLGSGFVSAAACSRHFRDRQWRRAGPARNAGRGQAASAKAAPWKGRGGESRRDGTHPRPRGRPTSKPSRKSRRRKRLFRSILNPPEILNKATTTHLGSGRRNSSWSCRQGYRADDAEPACSGGHAQRFAAKPNSRRWRINGPISGLFRTCVFPAAFAHNLRTLCLNPGTGRSNFLCAPRQALHGQVTVGSFRIWNMASP